MFIVMSFIYLKSSTPNTDRSTPSECLPLRMSTPQMSTPQNIVPPDVGDSMTQALLDLDSTVENVNTSNEEMSMELDDSV